MVPRLCGLLISSEAKIIEVVLEGLQNILEWGAAESKQKNKPNSYTTLIKDLNGLFEENHVNREQFLTVFLELDKIEELQSHQSNEVAARARYIMETYFHIDQDDLYLNCDSKASQ